MGTCESKPEAMAVETSPHPRAFQMWVVKVSDVLHMPALWSHEVLQKTSLLKAHRHGFFTAFVSHQWLGNRHPDQTGAQFKVLQEALRGAIDGSVKVQSDTIMEFMRGHRVLTPTERVLLRDGYIWMDWFCIPQDPGCKDEMQLAVESIPSYIDCSDVFVALVPSLRHESGQICDYESWLQRGAADAAFLSPQAWIHRPAQTGDFSVESDRSKVMQMLRAAMDVHIANLRKSKMQDLFRFYTARYTALLGLPDTKRTPEEFIADFGFGSMEEAIKSEALSGDSSMVRTLLDAKAPLATKGPNLVEVNQLPGQTPLHFAVLRGIGSADVMKELFRGRADPNCSDNIGIPLLSNCKDPATVDLLVSHQADVNFRTGLVYNTPLAVACCKLAPVGVVARLLELRADPNLSQGGESASPLMGVAYYTKGLSRYAVEVAGLLAQARADVNQAQRASGVWRFAELVCRASQRCGKDSALIRYFAENSSTPLGLAAYYANEPMISFLLSARADVNHRNHRGHTPLMLAAKGQTSHLFFPGPSSSEKGQGLASLFEEVTDEADAMISVTL